MGDEPSQEQITAHFREMARGKVSDADIQSIVNKGVGGRMTRPIVYQVSSTHSTNAASQRPVQNVTSDIVQAEDQAKSRLGRAINLRMDADGDSIPANLRRRNISTGIKQVYDSDDDTRDPASTFGKKRKRSGGKHKKRHSSSSIGKHKRKSSHKQKKKRSKRH